MTLMETAIEVFGSKEMAIKWFNNDIPALGNRKPVNVLKDADGRKSVLDVLNTLKCKVYL